MNDKTPDTNTQEPVAPSPAPGSARRQFMRRGAAAGAGAVLTVHHQRSFATSQVVAGVLINGRPPTTGQFIVSSAAMCHSLAAKHPGVQIQAYDTAHHPVVITGSFQGAQLCAVNPPLPPASSSSGSSGSSGSNN